MIAFGPVPSRRLGRSLGINPMPDKACTYSCIYCQVGITAQRTATPRAFAAPEAVAEAVRRRVQAAMARDERIDYLTFVPDGEPGLDAGLGESIDRLRPLGIPIAVISNGSLLWRPEVREAMGRADWVSVKVDAVTESEWRHVDHPHPDLSLDRVLDGVREFAAGFAGTLCTETMLVAGVNDTPGALDPVAGFLSEVAPQIAYLAVPTRPPALPGVRAPDGWTITRAFELFSRRLKRVELLIELEGDDVATSGNVEADLIAVTAVHPLRRAAVAGMLERSGADWSVVDRLLAAGAISEVEYGGARYYVRTPPRRT